MTPDGRYAAFNSTASDLVSGVTSGNSNVFVWDRTTGATTAVTNGNGGSTAVAMTPDGRYVAFNSTATNLVSGVVSGNSNVFVWDRSTGTINVVTNGNGGSTAMAMTPDGRYVAFNSTATNLVSGVTSGHLNVFVWDRSTGTINVVTNGNGVSESVVMSADGGVISFSSTSTNLVPGDTGSGHRTFVWDRSTGTTRVISPADDFQSDTTVVSYPVAVSADGRYITYYSDETDRVFSGFYSSFVSWDTTTQTATNVAGGQDSLTVPVAMTPDGRYVTLHSDISLVSGVTSGINLYLWDRTTGNFTAITTDGRNVGYSEPASVSPDGRYVTYGSGGVSRWDHTTGNTTVITAARRSSGALPMSSDGRFVTFSSPAADLVPGVTSGNTNVFLWDSMTAPAPPTGVSAVRGNNLAVVSWKTPTVNTGSPITSYTLTPYIGATAQTPVTFNGNATTQTVTGLINGTTYTFKVKANNAFGSAQSISSNPVTPARPPSAPTISSATPGNNQVIVAWTGASNGGSPITGYTITPYMGSTAQPATTFNSTVRTQTMTGLVNGTTYTFKVAGINATGTGPQSAASNPVTPARPPSAPTISSVTAGDKQVTVAWSGSSNGGSAITGYTITPYIGSTAQPATTFNSTVRTQTVTGLTNGTVYTFKVAGINVMGTGPQSAASSPVTPAAVPTAPTIGTATAGNTQATVSWTTPSDNGTSPISGYLVTPYIGYTAQPVRRFNSTVTHQTITGLANGTTYRFKVAAINGVGTGPQSAASNAVTPKSK